MPSHRLPVAAKRRLLLLIVAGGLTGALAALTANRTAQLSLVAVAAALGILAGLSTYRAKRKAAERST